MGAGNIEKVSIMCGICGDIRPLGEEARPEVLSAMAGTMVARGPDSHGLFVQGRVGLAHRRLKIIDLSDAAQQPMVDAALGLAIVYNGAIYNYNPHSLTFFCVLG